MNPQEVRPRGVFRARTTRDGEGVSRDGQVFVLVNELANVDGSISREVMFEDGFWMLAAGDDWQYIDVDKQ